MVSINEILLGCVTIDIVMKKLETLEIQKSPKDSLVDILKFSVQTEKNSLVQPKPEITKPSIPSLLMERLQQFIPKLACANEEIKNSNLESIELSEEQSQNRPYIEMVKVHIKTIF